MSVSPLFLHLALREPQTPLPFLFFSQKEMLQEMTIEEADILLEVFDDEGPDSDKFEITTTMFNQSSFLNGCRSWSRMVIASFMARAIRDTLAGNVDHLIIKTPAFSNAVMVHVAWAILKQPDPAPNAVRLMDSLSNHPEIGYWVAETAALVFANRGVALFEPTAG